MTNAEPPTTGASPTDPSPDRTGPPRVRRRYVSYLTGLIGAVLLALVGFGSTSTADRLDDRAVRLSVVGLSGGGPDVVDFETLSFADAVSLLSTGTTQVELPVIPLGGAPLDIGVATIESRSGAQPSVAIVGSTNLLGLPVDVLVTATWESDADTTGTTAVVVDLRGADLTSLVQAELPVAFSNTLIGIARTPQTLDGAELPSTALAVLSDGSSLDPTLDIVGGVSVRALTDATDPILAQAASDLGLEPVLRLEGSLSGQVAPLFEGAAAEPNELSLRATAIVASSPGQLPSYVAPTGAWSLTVQADTSGALAVRLDGSLVITVGETTADATVSAAVAYAAPELSVSLTAGIGSVDDLFGQQWLDLDELTLDLSISSATGVSASLDARLGLRDLTGNDATAGVTLALDADAAGLAGSLDIDASAVTQTVTVPNLTTGLGGAGDLVAQADLTFSGFTMSLSFDTRGGFSGVAALSSRAGFSVGSLTVDGNLLVRAEFGTAAQPQFLLMLAADIEPGDVSLAAILGPDAPFDVSIPSLQLSISTGDLDIAADDLDAATAAFLGDGEDLSVPNGVVLGTDIQLEQSLVDITGALGISSDGLLRTELRVPLAGFTSLDTSITVYFPELTGEGAFRSGNLALEAKLAGGAFSVKIVGEAEIAVPRDQDPLCQGTATPPAGYSCTDLLAFRLDAAVAISPTSTSLTVGGELIAEDGWSDPTGLRGLTIFGIRLEGGVELGPEGPQVKLGFRGQLRIDGLSGDRQPITVTTAFSFGITPNPPFVIPEGFTFASDGFGLADVTTLAEVLTQQPIGALDLPADLRLEDVFVSVSTATNPDLCLTEGFTIQAQLHLGGQKTTDGVPACDPQQGLVLTDDCAQRASCLAAVSINAQTNLQGTPGLTAAARVNGFDIGGVLQSNGIDLQLQITPTVQRLFISGDASLQIPLAPPQEPLQIAEAVVLVDITPFNLLIDAEVVLGDPQGATFGARLQAEGQLDLADPRFVFSVEFDTALLEEIGLAIEQGVNDVVAVIDDLLVISTEDALIFNNLDRLLREQGTSPAWVQELVTELARIETEIENANKLFTDIGLPPPILITELRDIVLNGVTITSGGTPAIDYGVDSPDGVDGCLNLQGRNDDGNCYGIPPFTIELPGICDDAGFRATAGPDVIAVLCGDFSGIAVATQVFEQNVLPALGVGLPAGLDAATLLAQDGPTLAGGQLAVTCGGLTIDTTTGTISEPAVTMTVGSRTVLVGLDVDPFGVDGGGLASADAGVDALLGGLTGAAPPAGSPCATNSITAINPEAAIVFETRPGDFDEQVTFTAGDTVTVLITCDAPTATVRFGDGSVPVLVDLAGGNDLGNRPAEFTEVITHTWLQASRAGLDFVPTVSCGDGFNAPGPAVEVRNAAVVIDELVVLDMPVAAGGVATVEVRFTDPGTDAHEVELRTGVGPVQVLDLPARRGAARAEQRVASFEVPLPLGFEVFKPSVDVTDGETKAEAETIVDLVQIAPTVVGLSAYDIVGSEATQAGTTPVAAAEGQGIIWRLQVNEPNLSDGVTAEITFSDGTTETVTVAGGATSTVTLPGVTFEVPVASSAERSLFFVRSEASGGEFPWSIRVEDSTGRSTTSQINVVIAGVAPQITEVVLPPSVRRLAPFNTTVRAVDPGGGTMTLEAEWGDGTTSTASSDGDGNGNYTLTAEHTYTVAPGTRLVRLTLTDASGLSTVLLPLRQIQVTPAAPRFTGWDLPAEVDEYQGFDFTYSFTADGGELYKVEFEILETGERGAISQIALVDGAATIGFSLRIADDDPVRSGGSAVSTNGIYTVRATVTGLISGLVSTDTRQFRVRNLDPVIEEASVGDTGDDTGEVRPGKPFSFAVRYTDPGLFDEHSVTIDWGDGETSGPSEFIILRPDNRQVVVFTHTYASGADEPYLATVTLTDDNGGTDSGVVAIPVIDAAPEITALDVVGTPTEGGDATISLSFDDATTDDSHTVQIDWGDGSVSNQAIEPGTTELTNVWPQDGTYQVTTAITDGSGQTATASLEVVVTNVAPTISVQLNTGQLDAGTGSGTIVEGGAVALDIVVTDPSPVDSHTVTIDWGDGWSTTETPAGADATAVDVRYSEVTLAPTGRSFTATNAYGDDGVYEIIISVVDDRSDAVVSEQTLTVVSSAPVGSITTADDVLIGSVVAPVSIGATVADVGSDDLTFVWTVDGVPVAERTLFADPAGPDASPSPQLAPRIDVTSSFELDVTALGLAGPCRYEVGLEVVDDDGARTELGTRTVLILGAEGGDPLNTDEWREQFRAGGFDAERIACLGALVGSLSTVLDSDVFDDVDRRGVPTVLSPARANDGQLPREQRDFDRQLATVLLNAIDGRSSLDEATGDGSTLADLIAESEVVRLTTTDWKELRDVTARLRRHVAA